MTQAEKTIFEKGGLKITRGEVRYGQVSYRVADITGVEVKNVPWSPGGAILLLVLGAVILLFVITTGELGSGCEIIPIIMVLGGVMMFISKGRDSFQVCIQRGEKVTGLFTTKDEELAREIEAALQTVITKGK
jgi:hypothetical protein